MISKHDTTTGELEDFLLESLEAEMGGVRVYEAALPSACSAELRNEWEDYLEEGREQIEIVLSLLSSLHLDPAKETERRRTMRSRRQALVDAITRARESGGEVDAQLIASECVVLAETQDADLSGLDMVKDGADVRSASPLARPRKSRPASSRRARRAGAGLG